MERYGDFVALHAEALDLASKHAEVLGLARKQSEAVRYGLRFAGLDPMKSIAAKLGLGHQVDPGKIQSDGYHAWNRHK